MKIAVLIDGGHVRALAQKAGKTFNPDFIEKVAPLAAEANEQIQRILYYDCAPFNGTAILPVSGGKKTFSGSDQWLRDLSHRNLFAVRLGVLKFRGWLPKNVPIAGQGLQDTDFKP